MRFVLYGAGAVGGVVGARLAQHGHDVALIARGAHYHALANDGLQLQTPKDIQTFSLPVFDTPRRVAWRGDEVVLLAMKSQDTQAALEELSRVAPLDVPVMCLQNGVANERAALRRFPNVYGIYVWCPTSHLSPGVVQAWSMPKTGVLDVGRFPRGTDRIAEYVAAALRESTFYATARGDVMRWKYRKLLSNLGNAVEALCGAAAGDSRLIEDARREATECFRAAHISFAAEGEDMATREHTLHLEPIDGQRRGGGSTWQSLATEAGRTETDYLNGEIVLLGRLHGVATPVNELLQWLTNQAAREGAAPGSMTLDQLEELLPKPH